MSKKNNQPLKCPLGPDQRATLSYTHQSLLTRVFPGHKIRDLIRWKKEARAEREQKTEDFRQGKLDDIETSMWVSQFELRRRKKQEYNASMGKVYEAVESGKTDAPEAIAKYLTNLAEDEQAWRTQRKARKASISIANELLLWKHIEARYESLGQGIKARREGYARKRAPAQDPQRALQQFWSDHHHGADLPGSELPVEYGEVAQRRRFAHTVSNALEYKRDHRARTETNIFLAGDLIEGFLAHDMRSGEPLADQFITLLEYLIQAIQHNAAEFPVVNVYSSPGNHDRNKMRHPGRATFQKWDSFQTMLFAAVRAACRDLPNVKWHLDRKPYVATRILGHWTFATHGDTILKAGNPGKVLRVSDIISQVNSINATLRYGGPFKVFAIGHVHTSVQAQLENAELFINGPLCPSSGYGDAEGYYSMASQWMWETTEKYSVGDMRRISVGPETDADSSLDNVIKPLPVW